MSVFSDQLKKARIASGYTVRDAVEAFHALEVDISEKTLYGWERGIRTPDADVFLRICQVYRIDSISDFLTGERKQGAGSEMTRKYEALDEHGKHLIDLVLEEEFKRVHPVIRFTPVKAAQTESRRKMVDFWVSEQSAAAGTGTYLNADAFSKRQIPADCLVEGASFGVPVSGDSMQPKYFDGDLLLINKRVMPEVGEIGIFLLDGMGFVKKRGKSELISLNPAYDPIPMNQEMRCFGKVVGVIRAEELAEC